MKIKYTFQVEGTFRLDRPKRFLADDGALVSVGLTRERLLRQVFIVYDVSPPYEQATLRPSSEEGVAGEITIPDPPRYDDALKVAARLEAKLAVFGVERIYAQCGGFEWVGETEEERLLARRLGSFHQSPGVPPEAFPVWRLGVFRAALRAPEVGPAFQFLLAYYRAGWTEVKRFRYVEAYFFFFLFIDALFAESNTKNNLMLAAFLRSAEFVGAVRAEIKNANSKGAGHGLTEQEAISKLVDTRGRLFHNPAKRSNKWNPDVQSTHAEDAMFLARVCGRVVRSRVWGARGERFPAFPTVADAGHAAYAGFLDAERALELGL